MTNPDDWHPDETDPLAGFIQIKDSKEYFLLQSNTNAPTEQLIIVANKQTPKTFEMFLVNRLQMTKHVTKTAYIKLSGNLDNYDVSYCYPPDRLLSLMEIIQLKYKRTPLRLDPDVAKQLMFIFKSFKKIAFAMHLDDSVIIAQENWRIDYSKILADAKEFRKNAHAFFAEPVSPKLPLYKIKKHYVTTDVAFNSLKTKHVLEIIFYETDIKTSHIRISIPTEQPYGFPANIKYERKDFADMGVETNIAVMALYNPSLLNNKNHWQLIDDTPYWVKLPTRIIQPKQFLTSLEATMPNARLLLLELQAIETLQLELRKNDFLPQHVIDLIHAVQAQNVADFGIDIVQ